MGEKQRAKNTRQTLLRLWTYLRAYRGRLLIGAFLVICTTALNLAGPYLMGRAIDDYIIPGDLPGLVRIVALMAVIYVLLSALTWLQGYVMAAVALGTVQDLRNALFTKVQSLPLRFFDQRPHGETMSRLTNDVENVNQVLSESGIQIVSGVLTGSGVIVLMLILQPGLAVVSFVSMIGLTYGVNRYIGQRTREGFRGQQKHLGELNGIIEETITGQRAVKAYHREPVVLAEFAARNAELRKASTHAQTYAGFVGPLMNFIGNLSLGLIVAVGGWMVVDGRTTVGTIAAFINYSRQLSQPINQIANLYNQIQSAIAGAERVFEVLDEQPEVDAPDAKSVIDLRGDVVFTDVSFSYDGTVPVLKHVDLHAPPGQLVALVGPTGAGKTTIINILTRFYEIDEGTVTIDGHDLRSLRKADLRRQLGVVLQDTFLFAGTVKDNIRYGRLDATDAEIIAAAELANADQFIRRLPNGYDTELSERGANFSQGQRQLLAIARAAISDPTILILDEATSSVDTRTEKHIQEALLRLMEGRTSFVIAHRLSTIRSADQILVINKGAIIERGNHADLLAQDGFYARLHNSQFTGDEELARLEEEAQIREQQLAIATGGPRDTSPS
ncbi:MAG: ABC transporter ATP-binding protein/permease [Chloroflexota bacterium]|nr:ABC transporter ATP-binding protein/permease [Chloroflexota bacterium]